MIVAYIVLYPLNIAMHGYYILILIVLLNLNPRNVGVKMPTIVTKWSFYKQTTEGIVA